MIYLLLMLLFSSCETSQIQYPSMDKVEQACFEDCKYYTNKFKNEIGGI